MPDQQLYGYMAEFTKGIEADNLNRDTLVTEVLAPRDTRLDQVGRAELLRRLAAKFKALAGSNCGGSLTTSS